MARLEFERSALVGRTVGARVVRRAAVIAIALSAWHGTPAAAQTLVDERPLDLRGAVQYALDHSSQIADRRATLANDEAQFAKDHATELPPATGLLQNTVAKQSNALGSFAAAGIAPLSVTSQNTAQLGTQWTLYNGSYNQILAQRAKRQVETDRANLRRAEQQLAQDVTTAFFAVSVRREAVRLDQADREYQTQLLVVARDNERVGRVAGVDVLRSQVNALRAQAALTSAVSDEATAREALAQTIGAPPDQPFAFDAVLPEPALPAEPLAALIATAQAARPDIAAASASLANARLGDSIIDTDRLPVLQVNAAFGNQTIPGQSAYIDPRTFQAIPVNHAGFWQLGATETLQIGFLDYGSRRAQHRAAHTAIGAEQLALDAAHYTVEIDVRQALRGAQTAAANLATAKQASALGAESARIAQLQYKNGLISLTDATQAERDNLSAQNDLASARVTYLDAIVHVRVAVGASDPIAIVDLRTP